VQLTMSFGVSASLPGTEFHYDEVFAGADAALYQAKRAGRDKVVVHSTADTELVPA
jgi:PleD family two-component response regulator